MESGSITLRLFQALRSAVQPALSTTRFLLAVMIPVSLAVTLLDHSGLLSQLATFLDPVMGLLGLPGEASLVFLSGALLNNYSAIAVISTLELSLRQISILACLNLICHNLIVESTIMKRTGSSAAKMVFLRITIGLVTAWLLNKLLPATLHGVSLLPPAVESASGGLSWSFLPSLLLSWLRRSCLLSAEIALIVTALMILQKIMEEFGLIGLLSRLMTPLMRLFGLPVSTSFLWIIANFIGLSYGSGIMIERVESGKLSISDSDLFNHHAGISHSLLEDSLLFAALGVPIVILLVPRLVMALIVVWIEQLRRLLFRRSFRVGTI